MFAYEATRLEDEPIHLDEHASPSETLFSGHPRDEGSVVDAGHNVLWVGVNDDASSSTSQGTWWSSSSCHFLYSLEIM